MKKDILFLCQFFYPEHNSSATLPFDTAKYLAANGFTVDALCGYHRQFGNNEGRVSWLNRLIENGCKVATIVHPTAYVSPTAHMAEGNVILPHAIVNTGCEVKAGCIINCGAIVDHGCVLEEGVHVCLGAIIKAENRIPRCMKIEAGEIIANRTYPV